MKILYLGIDLPELYTGQDVVHYPIIKIQPTPYNHPEIVTALNEFPHYTHLVFTSKNAVRLFFDFARKFGIASHEIKEKFTIALGQATAETIRLSGGKVDVVPKNETAEGVIEEIVQLDLNPDSYLFWPHSKLSRNVLTNFFKEKSLKYCACAFYDTIPHFTYPPPNLNGIDQIVFTSPSTIDAFIQIFGTLPKNKEVRCIGPITQNYYNHLLN